MSKIKTEMLPVNLTLAEKLDFGARAARALDAAETLRGEAKAAAADFKERIAEQEKSVSYMAKCIRNGMEYREVEVRELVDRSCSHAAVYRADTGEKVRTRPLTPSEMQTSLDKVWDDAPDDNALIPVELLMPDKFRDIKPDENGVRRFTDANGIEHEWIAGNMRTLIVGADKDAEAREIAASNAADDAYPHDDASDEELAREANWDRENDPQAD